MQFKREFHSINELNEVKSQLAHASRKPVYLPVNGEYEDREFGDERVRITQDQSDLIELRDRSALWNERDSELSYISSDQYQLVQHSDVLDLVQRSVGKTAGDIEMGVIRDYGSQIDGTLVFSNLEEALISVEDIVDTDGYIPPEGDVDPMGGARARDTLGLGMRISNSFDGTKKFSVSTMGYRFICQNWLVWGEEEIASANSKHVIPDDFDGEEINDYILEKIDDVIGQVFEIKDDVIPIIREAENQEIPYEWVPGILENLGYGSTYQKRITGLTMHYRTPRDGYTTAWRLYNAATTYLDNDNAEKISKNRYDFYQDKAWNLLSEPEHPGKEMNKEELKEFALID